MKIKIFNTLDTDSINEWMLKSKDIKIIDVRRRDCIENNGDGSYAYDYVETMVMYEEVEAFEDDGDGIYISGDWSYREKTSPTGSTTSSTSENWVKVDYFQQAEDEMFENKCDIRVMIKDGEFHPSLDEFKIFTYKKWGDSKDRIDEYIIDNFDIDLLLDGDWCYLENSSNKI